MYVKPNLEGKIILEDLNLDAYSTSLNSDNLNSIEKFLIFIMSDDLGFIQIFLFN